MFRGRVGHRPTERGMGGVGRQLVSDVEVQEEGLPLGTDQDVRRLYVPVENASLMGVMEPVGELRHDPGDRRMVAHAAQELEGGLGFGRGPGEGSLGLLGPPRLPTRALGCGGVNHFEGFDQLAAPARLSRRGPGRFHDAGECRTAEVRHADRAEASLSILMDREDRHDIGVLEPGQGLVFASLGRGDLQDHRTASQLGLHREVHLRERATSQRLAEPKAKDLVADLGKPQEASVAQSLATERANEVLAPDQVAQRGKLLGKSFRVFLQLRLLTSVSTLENLANQQAGCIRVGIRIGRPALQVVFDGSGAVLRPVLLLFGKEPALESPSVRGIQARGPHLPRGRVNRGHHTLAHRLHPRC